MLSVTSIESCAVLDEFRNVVLSVASIGIFVLSVANAEICVVSDECKILCCL